MGIEGEENFDPDILREQGRSLAPYLSKIADYLTFLKKFGWSYCGGLYDISCYKDITKDEAIAELKEIKIDINSVNLIELDEE